MKKPIVAILSGVILIIGALIFGVGGTILGMIRAFNQAAASGQTDSAQLAEAIQKSLLATVVGIPVVLIGIVLLLLGVIMHFKGNGTNDTASSEYRTVEPGNAGDRVRPGASPPPVPDT